MALCLVWALWAGWRLQARVVQVRPGLGAWLWGALDAALIAALPLALVAWGFFMRVALLKLDACCVHDTMPP